MSEAQVEARSWWADVEHLREVTERRRAEHPHVHAAEVVPLAPDWREAAAEHFDALAGTAGRERRVREEEPPAPPRRAPISLDVAGRVATLLRPSRDHEHPTEELESNVYELPGRSSAEGEPHVHVAAEPQSGLLFDLELPVEPRVPRRRERRVEPAEPVEPRRPSRFERGDRGGQPEPSRFSRRRPVGDEGDGAADLAAPSRFARGPELVPEPSVEEPPSTAELSPASEPESASDLAVPARFRSIGEEDAASRVEAPRPTRRLAREEHLAPRAGQRTRSHVSSSDSGRRTIEISGHVPVPHAPAIRLARAEAARSEPEPVIPRPRRRSVHPLERLAARPDRLALWAFFLGILLVIVAAASAHGG